MRWFEAVVSAVCYSICREKSAESGLFPAPYNDITRFTLRQFDRMAKYISIPLFVLTLLIDLSAFLFLGGFFHSQTPEVRGKVIRRLRTSSLGVFRDFVRFYESLVTVAIWSRDESAEGTRGES